ncbi:MAG TPA: hypothetical protein VGH87_01405 [Polyangiaceae bacterium]|jgi:hypothetical protein
MHLQLRVSGFIAWFVPWFMHLRGHAPKTMVVPMPLALERGAGPGVGAVF